MTKTKTYENYPLWFVLVSNLLSFSIYGIGIFIIAKLGLFWVIAYLLFILLLECRLLWHSCKYSCYYGKYCAFGKGKLCALLFKKGDPRVFVNTKIIWKSLVPDFLVFLIPLITGIILLIIHFNLTLILILILLLFLGFGGNAIVRGTLACKYCKQREIGCHAERLFNKKISKLIINPGSVGQPRDSNPKASYCILDNKILKAKIIRVAYNIDIAVNKIIMYNLPDFLAKRLFLGT